MIKSLPALERLTHSQADSAVLWFHGLGADGHDFEPIVDELGLSRKARVRFVFPHAPHIPVTVNGGMRMPAWYDISGMDLGEDPDISGILESCDQAELWLQALVNDGIPLSRIILAGFSQGGVVALSTSMRTKEPLAGVLALSTYIPGELVKPSPAAASTPIWMAHGTWDPVVPLPLGKSSFQALSAAGCKCQWSEYPMQHQVCAEEIQGIGAWLQDRLPLLSE